MSDLVQSGLSFLIPKDNRVTLTLLVAGTGALALLVDYYLRDQENGSSKDSLPRVSSKIETGNARLEEAIQYYESALVDMQRSGVDTAQRMQIRSMLLRAYEIQAILSPDEFNLRSSVMIEGSASNVIREIVHDNLSELDSGLRSTSTTPQAGDHALAPPSPDSPTRHVATPIPLSPPARPRSDSISSGTMSDFYEAFDILDDDVENDSFPPFYRDQIFLHKVKEFSCRTNRFQQFKLGSPSEYLVKVQCIRMAFDRLMKCPEKRSWMVEIGRENTAKLLNIAGVDSTAFCASYQDMMEYVGDLANLQQIREELRERRVSCINIFDIVIDFCLLDSFDDLDMPPAAVTSVLGNSWISQSFRKRTLSTAVWGMISNKSKKASPGGFLSRFYKIMAELSPSLAWGFLGDDVILQPICAMIRSDLEESLTTIFDEMKTDYSTLDNLADDLYNSLKRSATRLTEQLDRVVT